MESEDRTAENKPSEKVVLSGSYNPEDVCSDIHLKQPVYQLIYVTRISNYTDRKNSFQMIMVLELYKRIIYVTVTDVVQSL